MRKIPIKISSQGVINGIMMRWQSKFCIVVRLPNDEIDIETFRIKFLDRIKEYENILIFRGMIELIIYIIIGYKRFLKSIQKAKIKKNNKRKSKTKLDAATSFFRSIIGLLFFIEVFDLFPNEVFYTNLHIDNFTDFITLGLLKVVCFSAYVLGVSRGDEYKTTFEYHAAGHKTIICFKSGLDLNIENIKKQKIFYTTCKTTFVFIVLCIPILTFLFIPIENLTSEVLLTRISVRFLMMPLIAGILYEIIQFFKKKRYKHNNKIFNLPFIFNTKNNDTKTK